jgi:riboflavin biosynthesis pyrimidine reductase
VARGLSPQPLAVAVSGSLDIPLEGTFLRAAGQRRLVITGTAAQPERLQALRSVVRVILPDERRLDLARGLRVLRQDLGVRWLLAEGGPTLNATLLDGGLLDELFLTLSPRLVGGPERALLASTETPAAARRSLSLLSVHAHENELFLRYAVSPSS